MCVCVSKRFSNETATEFLKFTGFLIISWLEKFFALQKNSPQLRRLTNTIAARWPCVSYGVYVWLSVVWIVNGWLNFYVKTIHALFLEFPQFPQQNQWRLHGDISYFTLERLKLRSIFYSFTYVFFSHIESHHFEIYKVISIHYLVLLFLYVYVSLHFVVNRAYHW